MIKTTNDPTGKSIISVIRSNAVENAIPEIQSIIVGKVVRIQSRHATVSILMVDGRSCKDPFQGIVRTQDVRSFDKDNVVIHKCFRPGDIIR